MGAVRPAAAGAVALLVLLTGCGDDDPEGPPSVQVAVGPQDIDVAPTQYCVDGEGQRYTSVQPPVVEVSPDQPITLTVPDEVAEQGWSVQVFDDRLDEQIGEVEVEAGSTTFDGISSSDVVPAAFYLVVVEDAGTACGEFSGAWPVGFIRAE
ncbi:DUF2771 family protein [Trujillonella endophytica]|uniref:DUF2771 domain-containing protein n=1 Tax=Trujillonella endophytica TaxID=673521 RepID=A0A1H8V3I7_9ACTN|nr:DUF2771 family protein [Trujillella endophytica]SEP09787.1 Protein of unknown function [Trujillella endophytica]